MYRISCSGEWCTQWLSTDLNLKKKLMGPLLFSTLKIIWNFRRFRTNHWPSLRWGGLGIAEKPFREAATGHVHWRTLVAVAERFLGVGCSLLTSLVPVRGFCRYHSKFSCVGAPCKSSCSSTAHDPAVRCNHCTNWFYLPLYVVLFYSAFLWSDYERILRKYF